MARFTAVPLLVVLAMPLRAQEPFRIQVVDAATGRGIPLVELTTTNHVVFVTDSGGMVAFDEPGLMDQRVFFSVRSHGYRFPADGFGYTGKALQVTAGAAARLEMERINVAERLYRITGQGVYRDSVLLGDPVPIRQPLLSGRVTGQDSVQVVPYRGRLAWFWGDTNRPAYPLGQFATSGATSELPGRGGLDPSVGIDLEYFVDERGFSRKMCPVEGPGPVWIDGLLAVADRDGRERLVAHFVRVKSLAELLERGLALHDDAKEQFVPAVKLELDAPVHPRGHSFRVRVGNREYLYFADPLPVVRVEATLDRVLDPKSYEAFTCLQPGARQGKFSRIARDGAGRATWSWQTETAPVGTMKQRELLERKQLNRAEAWTHLQDVESGREVLAHRGSVHFNEFRRRWLLVAVEQYGESSLLGEVWLAEADTPLGPWVYARKVVTHDRYSFYNPTQHPFFDQDGGRLVYFEGTYVTTFSGNPIKTPRYDYNQVMYRLDLADPRLALPAPVYRIEGDGGPGLGFWAALDDAARGGEPAVAFFAVPPERAAPGLIPVNVSGGMQGSGVQLSVPAAGQAPEEGTVLFQALPVSPGPDEPWAATTLLFECIHPRTGHRHYCVDPEVEAPEHVPGDEPLCRVWRSPRRSWQLEAAVPVR